MRVCLPSTSRMVVSRWTSSSMLTSRERSQRNLMKAKSLLRFLRAPLKLTGTFVGSHVVEGSIIVPLMPFSPVQDGGIDAIAGPQLEDGAQNKPAQRKTKRVRLLLDARTELTDDELKVRLSIDCENTVDMLCVGRSSKLCRGPGEHQARSCPKEIREGKRQTH